MVEASHANKIAPKGIHPRAFSNAKKLTQGFAIHPRRIKTVAQIVTVAYPKSVASSERPLKRF